ncbi:arrestin domain-containing protein 3-like [Centroberyx gerrardi]|uniref:arrestin domain-containing protein 3-like n=1 Tax=Centroberyx gerrardi TaxID=166262 RepID=UPI003AACB08A
MPSSKELTLTYNVLNDENTFSEGDTLTGRVTLTLAKDTKVKSLFVKVKGDANVHWTEGSGDDKTSYSAFRRYFKLKECLIPEDTLLPQGIHTFNFMFTIPQGNMPSSFKGSFGKIVYMLEAKMCRSWRMDCVVQTEFSFVSMSIPAFVQFPQERSVEKEMGLFSKGQVQMAATVDRRAYAPGETVAVVANVNNSSSKKMTPKFTLKQNVMYFANGSTKTSEKTICKMVGDVITPETEQTVTCPVEIPSDLGQTIHNCDIISVDYYLKVYLDISFASDPEIKFPLVIIPPGFSSVPQPGGAVGLYPPGAVGGPSNSDFPPPAVPVEPYPVPFGPGTYGYPAAPDPAQQSDMRSGYNNPLPQQASPYASPFSSSSSSSVHHPPPNAPAFHPPPTAPPMFGPSPTAPTYNLPPAAEMMNTNFLSQPGEEPPSYMSLPPPPATEKSPTGPDAM